MENRHGLPCFNGCGTSCCSFFNRPIPHLYCFKCERGQWNLTEEEILELEVNNLVPFSNTVPKQEFILERGVVAPLVDRGISKEIAEKFRVETLFNDNVPYGRAYNHFNDEGEIISQKIKSFDGKIKCIGNHSEVRLFGIHMFPAGGKFLTITEGEEDAMACYQMLKAGSPNFEPSVISIPDGASSAEKACKRDWEYINSFEHIILAFDGDDVGKKAAEKIARLFDYKPKIVLFSDCKKNKETGKYEWKDANDYLKGGKQKEFINLWWRAEKVAPKGVASFKSLWSSMTAKDNDLVVPFPWKGLERIMHGMRTGRFYIWKAKPKIGKTQTFKELAYHIHSTTPHNSALILLEETKKNIGLSMCALHLSKPIHYPNFEINMDELAKAHQDLSGDDRITIFDPEDTRTVENIMAKIMYFVKAHNVKFVFLDHISMLAYQSGEGDERRFLDKLIADLKELTTSLDICIMAITHVNDEGQTRGSRAFAQLCDFLVSLERDKLNADPIVANTTEVIVEENRLTGESGMACRLFYDKDTGRMTELDDALVIERKLEFDK